MMRNHFLIAISIVLASSCAQVLTPDGGIKDLFPPRVISYAPDSAATNFKSKSIVLLFNEYIQLKDLQNQLIVSPPLNKDPDVTIKKKELFIENIDSLLANTTYTISFGNAIRDITENNVLDNFRYTFSTGPIIDSLQLSGKIINASTLIGEKGILVMLYAENFDSVPLKKRPYYFTKTKEDGSYLLTNLKAGIYKVFALEDKNSNYLFDNPDERIAFSNTPLSLLTNKDSFNLILFREGPKKQKLMKASQIAPGRFCFSYALPLKNPQLIFRPEPTSSSKVIHELSVTGDSIDFWFDEINFDSLTFFIRDDATQVNDSVTMQLVKVGSKNSRVRAGAEDPRRLTLKANIQAGQKLDLTKNLVYTCNNPLKNSSPKNIFLLRGKDTLIADISLSENKRILSIKNNFEEDSMYSLFMAPGALTDWFGQKNDTVKLVFTIQQERYYGALKIKLTNIPTSPYILQLVTEKDQVIRELKTTERGFEKMDLLPPGQYRLKLIADENKNGKWDTGNYLKNQQPEKIIYYENPIKMRSGWDLDIEWIFK